MLQELEGQLDLSRVHFAGKVDYQDFLRLLQRSDAHVYLTYPFVASWSLREAMAMGCAIVGSATAPVQEFLTDQETAVLVPFTEPDKIADGVLEVLHNKPLATRLRRTVREKAEQTLCIKSYLAEYEALIARLVAKHKPEAELSSQENAEEVKQPAKSVKKPASRRVASKTVAARTPRTAKKAVSTTATTKSRSTAQKMAAKPRKTASVKRRS